MTGECHVMLIITQAQRRKFTQTKMELDTWKSNERAGSCILWLFVMIMKQFWYTETWRKEMNIVLIRNFQLSNAG